MPKSGDGKKPKTKETTAPKAEEQTPAEVARRMQDVMEATRRQIQGDLEHFQHELAAVKSYIGTAVDEMQQTQASMLAGRGVPEGAEPRAAQAEEIGVAAVETVRATDTTIEKVVQEVGVAGVSAAEPATE